MTADLFLRVDGISTEQEAIDAAVNSALQHNKVYETEDESVRAAFREEWKRLMKNESKPYRSLSFVTTDEQHCDVIERIAAMLTSDFGPHLAGGRVRFGTSQKAFNLYLKYLWKLKAAATPPHCPIDSVVLAKVGIDGLWTKCDSRDHYLQWIAAIRERLTIAEWENEAWLRWRLADLN